jgi:hypothetical protein
MTQTTLTGTPAGSSSNTPQRRNVTQQTPWYCAKCGKPSITSAGPVLGCGGAKLVENCLNKCQDCGLVECEGQNTHAYRWRERERCQNYLNGVRNGVKPAT